MHVQTNPDSIRNAGGECARLGAYCCTPRWAAVLGCEAAESFTQLSAGGANVLCVPAFRIADRVSKREQLRDTMKALRDLGVERLIVLCEGYRRGLSSESLFIVEDHVNLSGDNPLIGIGQAESGDPFLDMAAPYDRGIRSALHQATAEAGIPVDGGIAVDLAGEGTDPGDPVLPNAAIIVSRLASVVIAARYEGLAVGTVALLSGLNGTRSDPGGLDSGRIRLFWASAAELLAADSGVS